jgi:hypothetical protein
MRVLTGRFPLMIAAAVLIIVNFIACEKKEMCRTCIARYNGETIATIEACSSEDEQTFKSSHYYATIHCE